MKWMFVGAGCVAAVSVLACGRVEEPISGKPKSAAATVVRPKALLVSESTVADGVIRQRLVQLGFDVTDRTGAAVQASDATGKAVVYVSESVESSTVANRLTASTTPIVCSEPALLDDLGMTGSGWWVDFGDWGLLADLDVVDPAHPLAARMSGRVRIANQSGKATWGVPAASASVVARVAGHPSFAAVFAYERGATMVSGTAPARRIGFFLGEGGGPMASGLSPEGWALFDAAIRYAAESPRPKALLVVNATSPLPASDEALRARLADTLGFDTVVVAASAVEAIDAQGKDAVVVSESSQSAEIGAKLKDVAVGLVSLEPSIWDDSKMSGPTWGTHYGDQSAQTQLDILDPLHPLAAALTGRVTVASAGSKFVWAGPLASGAHKVAALAGQPSRTGVFAFEKGVPMEGLDAPARRVGIFVGDPAPVVLTADGWKLFDAAIRWVSEQKVLAVTPTAVCKIDRGQGRYAAVFGYTSTSPSNVFVPHGERNRLAPHGAGSPPEWLKGGGEVVAFSAEGALPISWTVGNRSATVNAATPTCNLVATVEGEDIVVGGTNYTLTRDSGKIAGRQMETPGEALDLPGLTPGLQVGADGALTGGIPLALPQGRNGVAPNLQALYNSRGGSGTMGVGWTLAGLSEIRRCRKDLRHEPELGPITYGSGDPLCMGGERLMTVAGAETRPESVGGITIPTTGRELRTERNNFARVFEDTENDRFVVLDKSGRVMVYGASTVPKANKLCPAPCGEVRPNWPLVEVRDRFGNSMKIVYSNRTAIAGAYELLPDSIKYTGRGDDMSVALREVRFTWEAKPAGDQDYRFQAGVQLSNTQRIREIDIYAPDPVEKMLVRTYKPTYETSAATGRTRMKTFTECVREGGCRKPLVFEWEEGEEGFERILTGIEAGVSSDNLFYSDGGQYYPLDAWEALGSVDIDGDGFDDVVFNPSASLTVYVPSKGAVANPYSPGEAQTLAGFERMPWAFSLPLMGDLDGNGTIEVLPSARCVSGETDYLEGFQYQTTDVPSGVLRTFAKGGQCIRARDADMQFVDVDGDSLPERILGSSFSGSYEVLGNPLGRAPGAETSVSFDKALRIRFGDLDGSGRRTAFGWQPNAIHMDVNGDGISDPIPLIATGLPGATLMMGPAELEAKSPGDIRLGDFDGDGRSDVLIVPRRDRPNEDRHLAVLYRRGTAWQRRGILSGGAVSVGAQVSRCTRPRYAQMCAIQWNTGRWCFIGGSHDNGPVCPPNQNCLDGCTSAPPPNPPPGEPSCDPNPWGECPQGEEPLRSQLLAVIDSNGDGLSDFLQVEGEISQSRTGEIVLYRKRGSRPDLLRAIATADGSRHSVVFGHMGDRANVSTTHPHAFYTPGVSCGHPLHCEKRGQWMVKSIDYDAGLEDLDGNVRPGIVREEFSYVDGRSDVLGRGWLGFRERRTTRSVFPAGPSQPGQRIQHVVAKAESAFESEGGRFPFAGLVTDMVTTSFADGETRITRQELRDHGGGAEVFYRVVEGVGGASELNNGIYRVEFDRAVVTESFGAPVGAQTVARVTTTRTTWDDFGNIALKRTEVASGSGEVRSVLQVASSFDPRGRFLGLPERTESRSEYRPQPGQPLLTRTRTTTFEWNFTTGSLGATIREPAGAPSERLTTLLTRNADGIVVETRQRGQGSQGVVEDRVASVELDAREGLFPVRARNPMGHVTEAIFHPAIDAVVWSRDANGIELRRRLDRFGTLHGETGPKLSGTTINYRRVANKREVETIVAGGARTRVRFDRLGRAVLEERPGDTHGGFAQFKAQYDVFGRAAVSLDPYNATVNAYDNFGRPTSVSVYSAAEYLSQVTPSPLRTTTFVYPSFFRVEKSETVDQGGAPLRKDSATVVEETGQVVRREEALRTGASGGSVLVTTYQYEPDGLLARADRDGEITTITYDGLGRRRTLTTPDTGTSTFVYDAFDEVVTESDRGQRIRKTTTDALGRVVFETSQFDGILTTVEATSFEWDTAPRGLGSLASSRSPDGVLQVFGYDNAFGAPSIEHQYVQGQGPLEVVTTYDDYGRPLLATYPETAGFTRLQVKHVYDEYSGLLRRLERSNGDAIWQVIERDPLLRATEEQFGFGSTLVSRTNVYDGPEGQIGRIRASVAGSDVQDLRYSWRRDGMLRGRSDALLGVNEGFEHDSLGRITRWYQATDVGGTETAGGWGADFSIDGRGNILGRQSRTSGGASTENVTYTYDRTNNAGPYAVTTASLWPGERFEYDLTGNVTKHPALGTIEYTNFSLPRRVSGASGRSVAAEYLYDAAGTRVRKKAGGIETLYVGDLYERRSVEGTSGDVVYVLHVGGVAQIQRTGGGTPSAEEKTTYLSGDHLGTPDVTIDAATRAATRQKRDPFGNRLTTAGAAVDPRLSAATRPATGSTALTVGFTGHEQEDDLGVVNMRGRVYDPRLGRMLQGDPLVQSPLASQGWNRYSYVLNSPANLIDPQGFAWCFHENGQTVCNPEFPDFVVIGTPPPSSKPSQEALERATESIRSSTLETYQRDIAFQNTMTQAIMSSSGVVAGGGGGPSHNGFVPAPESIIGTRDYYQFRFDHAPKTYKDGQGPEYYTQFGLKNFDKFQELKRAQPEMADFVNRTARQLQIELERVLRADPTIESERRTLGVAAFDTHDIAYRKGGFGDLDFWHQNKVLWTIGFGDLFAFGMTAGMKELSDSLDMMKFE